MQAQVSNTMTHIGEIQLTIIKLRITNLPTAIIPRMVIHINLTEHRECT